MIDFDKVKLSRFASFGSIPVEVTLSAVVEEIRNPQSTTLTKLERIREEPDKAEELKKSLPSVTFSGVFPEGRKKDLYNSETSSRLVIADFDTYGNNDAELEKKLKEDPHVVVVFRSPRRGLKAAFHVDKLGSDAEFKRAFAAIAERYDPKPDASGKDVSRTCFLSYDPEIYTNPAAVPFKVPDAVAQPEPLGKAEGSQGVDSTPSSTPQAVTQQSKAEALKHVRNAVRYGEKIKTVQSDHSRHSSMLGACVTACRYALAGHLTEAEGLAVILEEYAKVFPGNPQRLEEAKRAFHDWGKKRAAEDGPLHPKAKSDKPLKVAEDVSEDELQAVYAKVFPPGRHNEPEYKEPVFRFKGHDVGQVGSLTAIKAKAKAGKTTVGLAMWTAYYTGHAVDGVDTFGFTVTAPKDRPLCFYFDSEQARRESWEAWRRAVERAGLSLEGSPQNIDGTLLCTSDEVSNVKRQALLFDVLRTYGKPGGCGAVIVDGVADFVRNVNDAEEVDEFMQKLRKLASDGDVCVVLTIHLNPGGTANDKARGHLGSDIARRAGTIFSLVKDDNGLHTLTITENRRGPNGVKTCFKWNEELRRHVTTDAPSSTAKVWDKETQKVLEPLQGYEAKAKDLEDRIVHELGLERPAAKKRYQKWERDGFLTKVARGQYLVEKRRLEGPEGAADDDSE